MGLTPSTWTGTVSTYSDDLPYLLDSYGEKLTKHLDFTDHLRKLASSKIKKTLLYLFTHRDYADKMLTERYDFLRNKETFQRCMDYAHREFGWTKKYI
jgi:hypothetical protein